MKLAPYPVNLVKAMVTVGVNHIPVERSYIRYAFSFGEKGHASKSKFRLQDRKLSRPNLLAWDQVAAHGSLLACRPARPIQFHNVVTTQTVVEVFVVAHLGVFAPWENL
jgi:hypothetical protein